MKSPLADLENWLGLKNTIMKNSTVLKYRLRPINVLTVKHLQCLQGEILLIVCAAHLITGSLGTRVIDMEV
ncbi:hypothetical protein IscW_ISCW010065 [Ixodes scapularis]|uniref:Uncharacterized protein n=1 Tax=Ixodes scapularis TaxID=6945 RepID=B7Q3I9_IXOSC|nr:hypothetical protein IscW_ISCW010065 [Ixodes scapularis]|eukprot:XP_002411287.1 hypothetical protein IscW_ISCW010065 [Ixodes scapularis]